MYRCSVNGSNISHTGYIGGSVLARLLKHPNARAFDISAITRSEEKARKLHAFGVNDVVGALDNNTLTENLASNAHVVFDCADADNLDAVRAIIRGLKRRHDATGDIPIYIHTSGTGVLSDHANGIQKSELIYNDLDPDQIESIPLSAPHRQIDIEVVDADKAGELETLTNF
ncbi:hypothetical protein QCA50_005585 [Cerrena zonata]|uniref:NAD(P)-binding domain-containing protein n=1 Tax=Cerrena zonata TaxID=2478898 RepID=A0AAW0GDH2_9APHY